MSDKDHRMREYASQVCSQFMYKLIRKAMAIGCFEVLKRGEYESNKLNITRAKLAVLSRLQHTMQMAINDEREKMVIEFIHTYIEERDKYPTIHEVSSVVRNAKKRKTCVQELLWKNYIELDSDKRIRPTAIIINHCIVRTN